ncbi:MAG TPA: hypothetical protein ENO22_03875 [candidate division Zixibacteria bacterium]|nr:hypothetical protein [candidate division Zixibacteria bacterium]HEQ98463.1 hypothetical protein [candidate division Zixibacteria bacterium]
MNNGLVQEFIDYGKELLSKHPDLPHEWKINRDKPRAELKFPRQSVSGFDVVIEAKSSEITVRTGELGHEHFEPEEGPPVYLVESVFGYVRDLLSPDMRLREKLAGNKPRWAAVESFDETNWNPESVFGLVLWNFFAKKSEKIYTNQQLPGRLSQKNN